MKILDYILIYACAIFFAHSSLLLDATADDIANPVQASPVENIYRSYQLLKEGKWREANDIATSIRSDWTIRADIRQEAGLVEATSYENMEAHALAWDFWNDIGTLGRNRHLNSKSALEISKRRIAELQRARANGWKNIPPLEIDTITNVGLIEGIVVLNQNIKGLAEIKLVDSDGRWLGNYKTDEDGYYFIPRLDPGSYEISVVKHEKFGDSINQYAHAKFEIEKQGGYYHVNLPFVRPYIELSPRDQQRLTRSPSFVLYIPKNDAGQPKFTVSTQVDALKIQTDDDVESSDSEWVHGSIVQFQSIPQIILSRNLRFPSGSTEKGMLKQGYRYKLNVRFVEIVEESKTDVPPDQTRRVVYNSSVEFGLE